mmetsp:Transcript_40430/g.102762  ORF Transcript_40430/g.102762 Transcript_40430/m.102762 type:complete len:140 (-) Transcript_40430:200-619(-)
MGTMGDELIEIAGRYNLPQNVLAVFAAKNVTSAAIIAKLFEDDEQFAEFFAEDCGSSKRLQLALKMFYFDALQCARDGGAALRRSDSPDSSPAGTEHEDNVAEAVEEDEADSDEEEEASGDETNAVAAGEVDGKPRWQP